MPSNSLYNKKKHPSDIVLKVLINLAAAVTVIVLVGIIAYILINGLPHICLLYTSRCV